MTPRTKVTTTAVGVIAAVLSALSACGGGSSGSDSATTSAPVGLEVDAGPGLRFGSETYAASAGTISVALVNRDTQPHSMVIVDADRRTLPGELKVGKSGDRDVKEYDLEPGTYQLLCLIPGHDDMKATLDVK